MVIKVLIVDPDIAFAVPIKRALEQSGDYVVNVFANGKAALDLIKREPQDVAILDFQISDIDIFTLITSLRGTQPELVVLTSTRSAEGSMQSQSIAAQGSIRKPYFARDLGPVIRDALAKQAPGQRNREDRPTSGPSVKPADTFYRLVTTLYSGDPTGHMKPVKVPPEAATPSLLDEPEIPEGATIRDLVSGQQPPAASTETPPDSTLESPQIEIPQDSDAPDPVASAALDAIRDDTVPLNFLELPNFVSRIERELLHTSTHALPTFTEQANQISRDEPPVSKDDTHPSQRIGTEPLGTPSDTQPEGGVVQEALEGIQSNTPVLDELPESEPHYQAEEMPGETQPGGGPVQELLEGVEENTPILGELEVIKTGPVVQPVAEASETPIAALAVQLTQFTVDSAAHATLVTQGGTLVASAGQLPPPAIAGIVETIHAAWQGSVEPGGSLVRFIQVPDFGDYLLYSVPTLDGMFLSMDCPAEMPLGVIRKQARNLITALQQDGDSNHEAVSEAARTLLSRPTDLPAPEGLREAASAPMESAEDPSSAEGEQAEEALPAEGPFSVYTFVWLPLQDTLTSDEGVLLFDWIDGVVTEQG